MLKDYFSPIFSYYLELLLAITRNISRSEMRLSRCDSACATQLYVEKNCYWIKFLCFCSLINFFVEGLCENVGYLGTGNHLKNLTMQFFFFP